MSDQQSPDNELRDPTTPAERLAAIAAALCLIPIVGSSLVLFTPGLAALAIQICNRTLGLRPTR